MSMTEKQRRFADEYIRIGEVKQAAVNAGYSTKSARSIGQENMSKPAVKAYITKRLDELKKESIAEQDEILQFLTSVMRGKASGTALVGEGMGAQSVEQVPPTVSERANAAVNLGKRYALWTEKQEIDIKGVVNFVDDIGAAEDGD